MTPYRAMVEAIRVVDPTEATITHDYRSPPRSTSSISSRDPAWRLFGAGAIASTQNRTGSDHRREGRRIDKFCVNFTGNAAFEMTGLDLETAVRGRIPSLTIVPNNTTMAIEIPHVKPSREKHEAPSFVPNGQTGSGQTALLEFMKSAETKFLYRNGAET
jgi:acetolactate synthase-1/2/3 large subunit